MLGQITLRLCVSQGLSCYNEFLLIQAANKGSDVAIKKSRSNQENQTWLSQRESASPGKALDALVLVDK